MSSRSMTDIAYEYLKESETKVSFIQLWKHVCDKLGFSEAQIANKIASFYSALMLDARFTLFGDNQWDLRERHTYTETHIDTSSLIIDDEEEENDFEEKEEEDEEEKEEDEEEEVETDEDEEY